MDPYIARSQFVYTSDDDRHETMYVLCTLPLFLSYPVLVITS
jgi:hypothetical protein